MKRVMVVLAALATVTAACGGESRELAGFVRDPAPIVGDVALPDMTDQGTPFSLKASPGNVLVVYFGYTRCPDFCPTTLSNIKIARQRLDDPERIEVAMVTVDPDHDTPVLADYVTGFVPTAHALATDDAGLLERAAAPLAVAYEVTPGPDGETEVAHTTSLYALDETGTLVLAWPPDITIDDLAADMKQLLDQASA